MSDDYDEFEVHINDDEPEDLGIDEKYKSLSKNILLCIIGETLDELAILQHINGWSKDQQTVIEYKTIEERCQGIKNDDVLSPKSKECIDLSDFQRDCSFIQSTIQKTFDEIRTNGSYKSLSELIRVFKQLESDETFLLEDTRKKELKYIRLQNIFFKEKDSFLTEINDMMTKIGTIKDEIEVRPEGPNSCNNSVYGFGDICVEIWSIPCTKLFQELGPRKHVLDFEQESKIKSKYITNWQNAKNEMNAYVATKKEEKLKELISEKNQDFIKEHRVHQEIKNIQNVIEMDFKKDMEKWTLKYEHDLLAITTKINDLQEKKDQQQQKTADMINTYIQRQKEIDSYKEYLVEQEKKRIEKERKDRAATKIQAWWRGTMVRKGFGKYKKKKDKKGKKKSPGDKKK